MSGILVGFLRILLRWLVSCLLTQYRRDEDLDAFVAGAGALVRTVLGF